jgi:hypothetical protein
MLLYLFCYTEQTAQQEPSRPSTSLQRLIRLDRVNSRDRFSMKKPLRLSARGASSHTYSQLACSYWIFLNLGTLSCTKLSNFSR